MKTLLKWLKEPLLHFLVLGFAIFLVFNILNPQLESKSHQITVDEALVQYLSQQFTNRKERKPTTFELKALIDEYIAAEIYYREGIRLGLDQNDDIIKRRVKQKFTIISNEMVSAQTVKDEQLQAYFAQHKDNYRREITYSFRHVFINPNRHKKDLDKVLKSTLEQLRKNDTAATESHMLAKQYSTISAHNLSADFGKDFDKKLNQLLLNDWSDPVQTYLGFHFIKLSYRSDNVLENFADIKQKVLADYLTEKRATMQIKAYNSLLKQYQVIIDNKYR